MTATRYPGVHVEEVANGWRGRVYDPNTGKWIKGSREDPASKVWPSLAEAETWAIARKDRHDRLYAAVGAPITRRRRRLTLAEFGREWIETLEATKHSKAQKDGHLRAWLAELGAEVMLDEIRPHTIQAALRQWRDGRRPIKVAGRRARQDVLRDILRLAHRQGEIAQDPMVWVDPIKVPRVRYRARVLSDEEFWAATERMPAHMRGAAELACTSGLRIAEVCALRKRSLRLRADSQGPPRVWVADMVDRDNTVRDFPKGKVGEWVPLAPRAVAALERHLAAYPCLPEAPIFRGVRGARLHPDSLRTAWRRAQVKVGIEPPARFHDLRHACITHLIQSEAPLDLVQAIARHAQIATTIMYNEPSKIEQRAQWLTYAAEGGQKPSDRRHGQGQSGHGAAS